MDEVAKKDEAKQEMAKKTTNDTDNLKKACIESFKDIYSAYVHLKALKVLMDSQMRYGSADDYTVMLVNVQKGKEKKIHKGLIEIFAEKSKKGNGCLR